MRHETLVTEVPAQEVERVLRDRYLRRFAEKHPEPTVVFTFGPEVTPQPEAEQPDPNGWKQGLEGYKEGSVGYAANCKCGWEANNPLPTKEAAEADADGHVASIYGENA